jgi:hypothetical protein
LAEPRTKRRSSGAATPYAERKARGVARAVSVSLDEADIDTLDALAARWGVGRSEAVRRAVAAALEAAGG